MEGAGRPFARDRHAAAWSPMRRAFTARTAFLESYAPLRPWHAMSALIAGVAVLAYSSPGHRERRPPGRDARDHQPAAALGRHGSARWRPAGASRTNGRRGARLASDRARLLDEVLHTSDRGASGSPSRCTTGRRLALARTTRRSPTPARQRAAALDAAVAETRAVMAAFHPATSTRWDSRPPCGRPPHRSCEAA